MTEGMVTRARAVDEQLSAIADQLARHDSVFSKIDSLCSTVQHHSDSFKLLRKSHSDLFDILRSSLAAQQTVMAEMMVKLQQLDKGSSSSSSHQPPLLPLPPSMPVGQINHPSPLNPPSIHSSLSLPTPRLPKIEVPFFSGDDVLGWLFQINHYFVFNQIPEDQRIAIAAFYMAGSARQWFQWLYSTDQLTHWDDFVRKLELRFGPSSFVNHEASLFKLKQSTTVTAFLDDFECLSTRVTGLSQQSLLNCFLSGLKEEIQRELYLLKPSNLHDAVGMAKLVEDKYNSARAAMSRPSLPRPPVPIHSPTVHRSASLPIKRLTPTEMAARREKGLCFKCDSKFTPCHRCNPALFLCLMVEQVDSVSPEEDPPPDYPVTALEETTNTLAVPDAPCISFHALMGKLVPSTLKIAGSINGQEVIVLVDGGSTNNFIQSRLADHFKLTVQPSSHMRVTIGNGDALMCGGECSGVKLKMGDAIFAVDLILLPIYGADLVLGVQWM